mmetsp:Transcript_20636/g.32908  ORF Transcript_20636/g.32908 Transcript_20636/m.32908 type:complete len:138 (+) Transcript_20636:106-519(+)
MGLRVSTMVTLRDQNIQAYSLQWNGDRIVGTGLSGQEEFSVSGLGCRLPCSDLRGRICSLLRTSTEKLTLYKDGEVMDYSEHIGDLEQVVVKQSIDEEVDVQDLLARHVTAEELVSAGLSIEQLKKAGAGGGLSCRL